MLPPFPRLRALFPLLLITLLVLLPPALALAQEGLYAPVAAPTVATAATTAPATTLATFPNALPLDTATYMLGLGPLGALLYGAYLLGKGVKLSIQVELSPEDRRILEELISVLRPKTRGGAP